jgi:peptidoglycan hydrolase-like protein with peptidoglycan-binding domain
MAQPTENFTSKENIREVDRVQEQVKQELASIKKTLFYETSEDGQVQYHLDVVKQYLETKKDKPWNELVSENRSTQIMAIQIALESMGYDVGRIDGIFGPLTKAKVAEFQKANELKVDGLP